MLCLAFSLTRPSRALLLLALFCAADSGQKLNFESQREPLLSLDTNWRFHTGDNPQWADPNFDDRSWSLLRSDKSWGQQGYRGYKGMAWYRITIENVGNQPLALLLAPINDSYQVFANGLLFGGIGKLPPKPVTYGAHPAVFQLPARQHNHSLTIAIRVWTDSYDGFDSGSGFTQAGSLLGEPRIVENHFQANRAERLWSDVSQIVTYVLFSIAGLTALSLYIIGHTESEYLWYALAYIGRAVMNWSGLVVTSVLISIPEHTLNLIYSPLGLANILFELLFYCAIFQAPRRWFFWSVLVGAGIDVFCSGLADYIHISAMVVFAIYITSLSLFNSWVLWAAWRGVRRGLLDARLLFWPVLLDCLVHETITSAVWLSSFGVTIPLPITLLVKGFSLGPVHVDIWRLTDLLLLFAALAMLIARFARTRRDEEQHTRDLEAARALQHMLVPAETPTIPSFSIASIYQPAQEVGGDFFQIIPLAQGVLLAIGDVSGKGLPAAMTVSLVIGALRTLADQTSSPSAILAGLNRRLIGRSAGFTTCLVAHLDANGQATLANAGHLAPYRNGEELSTIPNLPLGLSEDATYEESPLTLHSQDRFTFLSDGVLEAKNKQGELFGFARTQQTSTQPAAIIATAAQQFGQEDDITVLTIEYLPITA